ncbi:MAG: SAM-dependent chlorinase/fluorinase [Bacteroidota bacterium]
MAIVTFMSDYGWQDHYVAAVKAAIITTAPQTAIIDISHDINPFDISHGAYVLSNVFRNFPTKTAHLVSIDPGSKETPRYIALEMEDHFFVGHDSGLFSLITDRLPAKLIELDVGKGSSFPCKDYLAPVAARLSQGASIEDFGQPLGEMERRIARQLKATKKEIVGHVIRVDHYGNLVTNITQQDFEAIVKLNGSSEYSIHVGREVFHAVHLDYGDVESGNCYLLFNSSRLLQIGINKGNASELFGLKLDTPIVIEFNN